MDRAAFVRSVIGRSTRPAVNHASAEASTKAIPKTSMPVWKMRLMLSSCPCMNTATTKTPFVVSPLTGTAR
jgi:hypothetical protein